MANTNKSSTEMMETMYAMFIFANMNYKVCISNPVDHFVSIEGTIQNPGKGDLEIQLPAWRPGRYELANYAKNIRGFKVFGSKREAIAFKKLNKDRWKIFANGNAEITISYEYYANQPDAGASFAAEDFLYLNPVNCFMYVVGRMDDPFEVKIEVPENWKIACQLPVKDKTLYANNFDQLADSPFFTSPTLVQQTFEVNHAGFHFWFQGGTCPNMEQLVSDTLKYAKLQIEIFGELPLNQYHYLYLLLPDKFRHGVEHADSTVIAMGPAAEFNDPAFYNDFLAISSHELFHLWNVKRIRPEEMWPYDFTKENYSELGYIYEGITTYYGDMMLLRCGVWDFEQYAKSLAAYLDRHFNNDGRFNYSVAESSFDTWLDGYVPGVKGRKVSIYVEGLIAAWVADVKIQMATNGKKRLDEVMSRLYEKTWKKGKGYSRNLYKLLLEEVSAESFDTYFAELIEGRGNWDKYLANVMNNIGLELIKEIDEKGLIKCKIVKLADCTASQALYFDNWIKRA